jgi:hypothetical protein
MSKMSLPVEIFLRIQNIGKRFIALSIQPASEKDLSMRRKQSMIHLERGSTRRPSEEPPGRAAARL